jgi:quinol-cytochrome oxidoreductase complex cytochrome b subunit
LPFYAILRAIPDKNLGVLIFMFALILLLILPIFLGKNNLIRNS